MGALLRRDGVAVGEPSRGLRARSLYRGDDATGVAGEAAASEVVGNGT